MKVTQCFTVTVHNKTSPRPRQTTLIKSRYNLSVGKNTIEINPALNTYGVALDRDLAFKPHVTNKFKKASAKIAALRRVTVYSTRVVFCSWEYRKL